MKPNEFLREAVATPQRTTQTVKPVPGVTPQQNIQPSNTVVPNQLAPAAQRQQAILPQAKGNPQQRVTATPGALPATSTTMAPQNMGTNATPANYNIAQTPTSTSQSQPAPSTQTTAPQPSDMRMRTVPGPAQAQNPIAQQQVVGNTQAQPAVVEPEASPTNANADNKDNTPWYTKAAKGLGTVGKAAGAVAGIPQGMARAAKKGYNASVDAIGGPEDNGNATAGKKDFSQNLMKGLEKGQQYTNALQGAGNKVANAMRKGSYGLGQADTSFLDQQRVNKTVGSNPNSHTITDAQGNQHIYTKQGNDWFDEQGNKLDSGMSAQIDALKKQEMQGQQTAPGGSTAATATQTTAPGGSTAVTPGYKVPPRASLAKTAQTIPKYKVPPRASLAKTAPATKQPKVTAGGPTDAEKANLEKRIQAATQAQPQTESVDFGATLWKSK